MVVVANYFTKWVERETLVTITTSSIIRFLWKTIVCKFIILGRIISDNERQFNSDHYRD